MSGDIELEAWSAQLGRVDFRIENFLAIADRPGDHFSIGMYDDAVARIDPFVGSRKILPLELVAIGDIISPHCHAASDDIDAPLLCDMPERREPGLAAVP